MERMLARLSGGFVMALHDMPPARLREFVEGMRPRRPIALSELVERRKRGKSNAGLFAITVDDGVRDNIQALTDFLNARAWPATFYLPTQYLDSGEAMPFQWWWNIKPLLPRRRLQLKSGTVDFSKPQVFEQFSAMIERAWYWGRGETYVPLTMELVEVVAQEKGVAKNELPAPQPISWSEVERLSRNPLFQFESHGVSHVAMSALNQDEIEQEMQQSQAVIEEHTGRPCRHLCYPFGSPESIGDVAPRIASRYYDSAVTMSLNSADRGDMWRMGRIPLYAENSLVRARIKVLLRCVEWKGMWARRTTA
jgi:peptidoglycan/xylan/chitin deacetylase (PgdA/CDA1 family)